MPKAAIPGARFTKLKPNNGRLASAKSKTGNPACSAAMSSWVRARHGGPPAGAEVFKMLAKCRAMARQNKSAAAMQASGKLAEGRGTWQRSEKAAALVARRQEARGAAPKPPAAGVSADRLKAARAALAGPVPPELKAKVVGAFRKLDDQADRGSPVSTPRLRAELAGVLPKKPQFDRVMRALRADGTLSLHRSDRARAMDAPDRAKLVREGTVGAKLDRSDVTGRKAQQSHYVGASLRGAAAPAKTGRPGSIVLRHKAVNAAELKRISERPTTIDGEDFAQRKALKGQSSFLGKVATTDAGAKAPDRGSGVRANLARRIREARAKAPDPRELTANFGAERMRVREFANAHAFARKTASAAAKRPERADLRREAPDPKGLAAKADAAWAAGQKAKADGEAPDAAGHFARHDELMSRLRRASDAQGRAKADRAAPRPEAGRVQPSAAASARAAANPRGHAGWMQPADQAKPSPIARLEALKAARSGEPPAAQAKPSPAAWRSLVESNRKDRAARREKKAATLKAQRAELGAARSSSVQDLDVSAIHFDPKRFQYKLAHAEGTGSVGSLAGVKKWDPELGGVVQVWKDPADGKTYVVNGHNRLDLAKRLNAGKISARYVKAATADEAKEKGAITNIAEGRGTSIDAAKFFHTSKVTRADLEARGVPMREKVATEGLALAGLETKNLQRVVDGDLPVERAAIVGGSGLSHPQQKAVFELADKRRGEVNNKVLRELVSEVKQSSSSSKGGGGLFGDDPEEASNAVHRAALKAHVKERLAREKRVFGTVAKSRNAADLARANNVIDADASGRVSREAAENLATFDLLASRKSAVSALVSEGERRLAAGEKAKDVYESIYARIPDAVREDSR